MTSLPLCDRFPKSSIRRLALIRSSNVDKIIEEDEQPVQLCNYVDVYYNERITDRVPFSGGSALPREISKFSLREGDVIITKDSETPNDIAVPSLVEKSAAGVVCGYHLAMLRPDPRRMRGDFLFWSLKSQPVKEAFSIRAQGITRYGLTLDGISSVLVPTPDLPTQRAIADFLDRETARIDQLIEKKERMIEKIDARATSLTWTLVTGRDLSNCPTTIARFEWIGAIPSHWRAVRIKTMARLESGHTPNRSIEEYWTHPTIPWVSLADSAQLRRVDVVMETKHMISEAGLAGSSARILPAGTVAFTRDATVGLAAILGKDMAVSQHLVGWVCGPDLDPRYLLHVIYAMEPELIRLTWGATIKTIGMPDLRSLSCPLPPLDEQRQIVQRLESALAASKRLRTHLSISIEQLRELRTALITAAVTGQIDVATWGGRGETDRRLEAIERALEAERDGVPI